MNAQQELLLLRNQEALLLALRELLKDRTAQRKRLNDQLTDTKDRIILLEGHIERKANAARLIDQARAAVASHAQA